MPILAAFCVAVSNTWQNAAPGRKGLSWFAFECTICHSGGKTGMWAQGIRSREARRDDCWCSTQSLLRPGSMWNGAFPSVPFHLRSPHRHAHKLIISVNPLQCWKVSLTQVCPLALGLCGLCHCDLLSTDSSHQELCPRGPAPS